MNVQLTIHAKKRGKKIEFEKNFKFPMNWKAIPEELLNQIATHLLAASFNDVANQQKIIAAIIKHNMQDEEYEFRKVEIDLDFDTFQVIADEMKWMWSDEHFSVSPMKYFTHEGVRYYLPSDKLGNTVMGEFYWLDDFFTDYKKRQNKVELIRMVSVICRPARTDGHTDMDIREPFEPANIYQRAAKLSDLDPSIYWPIIRYFLGSLQKLDKAFGLFEKPEELQEGQAPTPNFKRPDQLKRNWQDVMMDLSKGTLSEYNTIFHEPTWKVMAFLKHQTDKAAAA